MASIMKTQLFVGQSKLRGALSKYKTRFNLLELRAEQGRVPRAALLRRWTEEVESNFVFSVMVSQHVGRFDQGHEAALRLGQETATALNAKWIVVQTDPAIGPSQRSRQRLRDLFARLMQGGHRVAWEPHGIWQEQDAAAWTSELGVHLVTDITRGDLLNEPVIYSRLPGLGTAARMTAGALENAAACLVHAKEAYVVVCGDGAGKASQLLRRLIADDVNAAALATGPLELSELIGKFSGDGGDGEYADDFDDEHDLEDASDELDVPSSAANPASDESASERHRASKKQRGAKRR